MFEQNPVGVFADTSTRVLRLPLVAIGATAERLVAVTGGLPAGAVEVTDSNVVMASTPCAGDIFRDVIARHAYEQRKDVLLTRTGLWPETLSPVTAEVALTLEEEVLVVTELAFFRHVEGGLWLVPTRPGPFIAITHAGLGLEMTPPFQTWHERSDGVCRAAAEIVRLSRRGR